MCIASASPDPPPAVVPAPASGAVQCMSSNARPPGGPVSTSVARVVTTMSASVISAGSYGRPFRANRLITRLSVDLLQTHRLIHARCEAKTERKALAAANAAAPEGSSKSSAFPSASAAAASSDQQTNVRSAAGTSAFVQFRPFSPSRQPLKCSAAQRTDSKASAVRGRPHKQTTRRMAAVGVALNGVLLPELLRIIWEFQSPGHRFDAERVRSELLTVSADGRSFETLPRKPGPVTGNSALYVWSRYSLRDGAQRWRVRLPSRRRSCWVGVGDLRSRPASAAAEIADPKFSAQSADVGDLHGRIVCSYSSIPGQAHAPLHGATVFRRRADFQSQSTVVQCTFDDVAHTLRIEIAGEPEAGAAIFPSMPSAEFLCPLISLIDEDKRTPALRFAMKSEDE
jgi:hypothetical protein